ncbi:MULTISPECIES: hypothetical protein [Micrococcus]|nr:MULTISPECIES: hypothetical protein [Micrococcus]
MRARPTYTDADVRRFIARAERHRLRAEKAEAELMALRAAHTEEDA